MNDFISKYQSGFLLKENSPEEIGLRMMIAYDYYQQGKLAIMGKNGRKMVAQEFDWQHIASKLIQVYAA